MSDGFLTLVPKQDHFEEAEAVAAKVIAWLVSRKIIKPFQADCVLGAPFGYPPDKNSVTVIKDGDSYHFKLITNGLEVRTERTYFQGYESFEPIVIQCPACYTNLIEGLDLMDYYQETLEEKYQSILVQVDKAIDEWYEGKTSIIPCPACGSAESITKYHFESPRGFSNLGFTFWNWSHAFKEDFIQEFEQVLGCPITIVPGVI